MSFASDHLETLAAVRALSLPTYMALMRACHDDQASFDAGRKAVSRRSEELAKTAGDVGLPDLTALLASKEYRDLLQIVSDRLPDQAPVVQHLLETKEYEQRLAGIKSTDRQAYLSELRVVSVDELRSAVVAGTIVNALTPEGQPQPIRSDEEVSGAFLEVPTATARVSAALLVSVLASAASDKSDVLANPKGLRLQRVMIDGELDLNWLTLPFPVGFEGCDFTHWVSAQHLTVPWLSFDCCDFTPHGHAVHTESGALNASSIQVQSSLRFWGCTGLGQLFIPDARIGSFSPSNPEADSVAGFRTVIDGAHFGTLVIPQDGDSALPFTVRRSIRIDTLSGLDESADASAAKTLADWLSGGDQVPEDTWNIFEGALRRSGMGRTATQFGILGARQRTRQSRLGWLTRAILDPTVRYFYDNLRAAWGLLALFLVSLGLSYAFAGDFDKSPLANDPLPESWMDPVLDRVAWSLMYALDTVASPLSLGQIDTVWPGNSWLALVFAVIKGLSLLLLGLLLIGATGIAERRSGTNS